MTPPPFETFFLPAGGSGQRYCVFHPALGPAAKGAIVFVHPFAEEMNKSRRMAALQSRAMSDAGYAVLRIDLLGCGDSSGDFGDASWQAWIDDVLLGCRWISERVTAPLWIWGLRAGCLLAAQAARLLPAPPHLLLWAPVISGKQGLQQFLRLKAAADLASGNAKEVLEQMRTDLAQGRPVEIAGYMLPAGIADGLVHASLEPPAQAHRACRVEWLELTTRDDGVLSPVAIRTLAAWNAVDGVEARGHMAQGPAFWQTSEIEDAPALVAATMAALTGASAAVSHPAVPAAAPTAQRPQGAAARVQEQALVFECSGEHLAGILTTPDEASAGGVERGKLGLVVVVGGPQYRVGSHRQFRLLARTVAEAGFPVLRFDVRGMGDSTGDLKSFEHITPDIGAAIDALHQYAPQVQRVALWGLCDGASAALLYCHDTRDERVHGLCLLNPWVRSEASLARTHVKHYYADRLRQKEFWTKLLTGKVAMSALAELWRNLRATLAGHRSGTGTQPSAAPFQDRMARGWRQFRGSVQVLLSGRDYTAREFLEYAAREPAWNGWSETATTTRKDLPEADHTFSTAADRSEVERLTIRWLRGLL